MKNMGINVSAPDINKSKFTFVPDLENNKIIYGIKGISKVNNDYANEIIQNRPYTSLNDFRNKVKSTKLQTINLIKSGAFDELEKCSREELLMGYFREIAGFKNKITMQNLPSLISNKLIPEEFQFVEKVFNFNKFLKKNKSGIYYELDNISLNFYSDHWDVDLLVFESGKTFISQTKWDKIYKSEVEVLRPWLKEPTTLDSLNETLMFEVIEKYGMGNRATWEMDSIGFYSDKHELDNICLDEYEVSDFFSMPETPVVKQIINMNGKDIPLFYLDRIIGTVIDKDKLKNMVTLLTPTGVVKVKIYKPQFIKYDKQLYVKDPVTGKKKITEKSWFTRGNKLLITGIRRDDSFIPKKYRNSKFPNVIGLITNVDYKTGQLDISYDRQEQE